MNGCYKMAWWKEKEDYVHYKQHNACTNIAFACTDIMPIHNRAWNVSFAVEDKALKALAKRRWGPLN